jgi:hypothetical protein
MNRFHAMVWAMLAFGTTLALRADVTWAVPESVVATPGATLSVAIATGAEFGEPGVAMPSTAIREIVSSLSGLPLAPAQFAVTGNVLRFRVTLPRPGVAVLAINLKPSLRELPRDRVERYLRAIHASEELRAAWRARGSDATWREMTNERVKTFIRVGQPPADDRSWAKATETGFEIVPESDPTAVNQNDVLSVRVLREGRTVAGCVVTFESQDHSREHVITTGDDGRASASMDARGAWLMRALVVSRSNAPNYDWESNVASLTIVAN